MTEELRIPPDHLIASFCVLKPYDSERAAKAVAGLRERGARYLRTRYLPWVFCGRTPAPPEATWRWTDHREDLDEEARLIEAMDIVQTDNDVEVFFQVKFAGGAGLAKLSMKELDWKSYAVALTACHHELLDTGGDEARRSNLKQFRSLALVLYDCFRPALGQIAVERWVGGYDDYASGTARLPHQWAVFGPALRDRLPADLARDLTACHFFQNLADRGVFFSPAPWLKNDATSRDLQHLEKLRRAFQSLQIPL